MSKQTDASGTASGGAPSGGRLRVCLAASGGGHLRQLLDLQPFWSTHDYFFVTEDTALGQSLRESSHPTHFVPHFGLGQARLGAPFKMLAGAFVNFFRTGAVMLRMRPDLVVSTGAGAVFFTVLWARLLGARIVVIESFARFEQPSVFGRMTKPLADDFVVQSAALAQHYPQAKFFDPFRMLGVWEGEKHPLLFATVGAVLPFDRLVTAVAQAKAQDAIDERVLIQVGEGGARPEGLECVETLPFDDVKALLKDASIVICHGGTGSLITALREGCHVIAMPRLFDLGEVYDDHQVEIVEAFAGRGLVQRADDADQLVAALAQARSRPRQMATTEPAALRDFLTAVAARLKPRQGRAAEKVPSPASSATGSP
jgi:UDP-N-acetylglucosamine transferase subunit ALG13